VLVISPTRELAQQIALEARKLLKHTSGVQVSCFVGGTNPKTDERAMRDAALDVLVATPGRLKDHVENTPGFARRLEALEVLILDEGDQLLDQVRLSRRGQESCPDTLTQSATRPQGFLPDIRRIVSRLPSQRQSLCFSATVPKGLSDVLSEALTDPVTVDCVGWRPAPRCGRRARRNATTQKLLSTSAMRGGWKQGSPESQPQEASESGKGLP
jgi:ATP-dependent RNA helicase MSS116